MTLDKFGRHLGRRTKRIYLIEESGDERIKQAIDQKVQSQLLQITKDFVSQKKMTDAIDHAVSSLQLSSIFVSQKKMTDAIDHAVSSLQLSSITKEDVRQLCAEEDAKLRCISYFPFTAVGVPPNPYYVINNTNAFIELWMDCVITEVRADTPNVDFRIQYTRRTGIVPVPTLNGLQMPKGSRIFIDRIHHVQSFSGSLTLEYAPLKK